MKTPIKLGGVLYTKDEEGEVWVEYDRVKNIVAQAQQELKDKVEEVVADAITQSNNPQDFETLNSLYDDLVNEGLIEEKRGE